jgi:uncharacterized protein (DUF362 family)
MSDKKPGLIDNLRFTIYEPEMSDAHFQNNDQISRRRFMARLTKAGISMAAACALGYFFHDPTGPVGMVDQASASIPDFSVSGPGAKIAIARGSSRKQTLLKAVDAMGGMGRFIRSGDHVVLKVNAAFASPAMLCATTHPELVEQIIGLCYAAGAKKVVVADNPINDPATCFRLTGIEEAAARCGAELALPKTAFFKPFTLKNGKLIRNWPILHDPLEKATKLIGMAPVKSHQRSGASMTMKNWYGLLGGQRNRFHRDIHTIIAELAQMVKPTLVILDGTFTMMTNGPTGGALSDLKQTDTLILGTDQVAVDAFGSRLLEKKASDLPYILKAEQAGVGTSDVESLKPAYV